MHEVKLGEARIIWEEKKVPQKPYVEQIVTSKTVASVASLLGSIFRNQTLRRASFVALIGAVWVEEILHYAHSEQTRIVRASAFTPDDEVQYFLENNGVTLEQIQWLLDNNMVGKEIAKTLIKSGEIVKLKDMTPELVLHIVNYIKLIGLLKNIQGLRATPVEDASTGAVPVAIPVQIDPVSGVIVPIGS